MNLRFAMLADHVAELKDGKLVIVGEFDRLIASAFPVRHGVCFVVARIEASVSEGSKHKIALHLVDEDGNSIMPPSPELELIFVPAGRGRPLRGQFILGMQGLTFAKAGDYEFHILVDGRQVGAIALSVSLATRPLAHGEA